MKKTGWRKATLKAALAASVLAVNVGGSPAAAADFRRGPGYYTAPAPLSAYSWTGPYLGANIGYQWGSITNHNPTEPNGVMGGFQAGYNWQAGQFVFGAETDIQLSGAEDRFAAWKFSNPWFGTLRGRVGYAMNNVLFFGTGGLAYGNVEADLFGMSMSKTHMGWTVGGGLEVALTNNWTAKAEYLFVNLNDESYFLPGHKFGLESNVLRLGVNYRF